MEVTNFRNFCLKNSGISGLGKKRNFRKSEFPELQSLGIGARCQKLDWWGSRAGKEVGRYLQPYGYNTRTWLTDRRTRDTAANSKDRAAALPRLCIASRVKKHYGYLLAEILSSLPPVRSVCGCIFDRRLATGNVQCVCSATYQIF